MVNASLLKYIFWSKQRSQNQNGYEFWGTLSFVCLHLGRRATLFVFTLVEEQLTLAGEQQATNMRWAKQEFSVSLVPPVVKGLK